jgi:AraC family transcriptional regulator of adaptative response / DNA-3-methyladenine glycosylase II
MRSGLCHGLPGRAPSRSENRERRGRQRSTLLGVELDRDTCYRVVLARDARHDGRFFTCVKSTGIYCRPICPARPPRLANCVFVPSAAAAHEAGYRPCLRCRPECSPDTGRSRGSSATVSRALALIDSGALDGADVEALAERLGIGDRQLRRLFRQHVGATPVAVAQTRRIHLAKQLVHDSDLSMTEVALASGFASLRRFNESFKQLFGRPPSALRRESSQRTSGSGIELLLPYRKPYDFPAVLAFLAARVIRGVEEVRDGAYTRVIEVDGQAGRLSVSDCPERASLRVRLELGRVVALPALIGRVRRMFDLGADPRVINAALRRDPLLARLVSARPGLRVPGAWDGFEVGVRAILGQQISVRAALELAGALVAELGTPLGAGAQAGLTHVFPRPERFDVERIARLGMPRARAQALCALALAHRDDATLFDVTESLEHAIARFTSLPGIGPWTAQYIALRALGESDAFLSGDVGLMRALATNGARPDARSMLARAEAWRPWRAYAVVHLWTADAAGELEPAPRRAHSREGHDAAAM